MTKIDGKFADSNLIVTNFSDQDERVWRNIDNNEIFQVNVVKTFGSNRNFPYFSENKYFDVLASNNTYFLAGVRNNRAIIETYNESDNTFKTLLYLTKSLSSDTQFSEKARSIAVDSTGSIYASLTTIGKNGTNFSSSCVILKSHISSSTNWYTIASFNQEVCRKIIIDKNDAVYLFNYSDVYGIQAGILYPGGGDTIASATIRSSSNHGSTFGTVDSLFISASSIPVICDAKISGSTYVYCGFAVNITASLQCDGFIRTSSFGSSSWGMIYHSKSFGVFSVDFNNKSFYASVQNYPFIGTGSFISSSDNFTWSTIDTLGKYAAAICIDPINNNIYDFNINNANNNPVYLRKSIQSGALNTFNDFYTNPTLQTGAPATQLVKSLKFITGNKFSSKKKILLVHDSYERVTNGLDISGSENSSGSFIIYNFFEKVNFFPIEATQNSSLGFSRPIKTIKTFGDNLVSNENVYSSVGYKNDYTLRSNIATINSINNQFYDASKNQESYTQGFSKTVRVSLQFYDYYSNIVFSTGSGIGNTIISSLSKDSKNNIYGCGYVRISGNIDKDFNLGSANSAFIIKSSDIGNTWTTIDQSGSLWNRIYVDINDNIYTFGSDNNNLWTVRYSNDAGNTWNTLETYQGVRWNG